MHANISSYKFFKLYFWLNPFVSRTLMDSFIPPGKGARQFGFLLWSQQTDIEHLKMASSPSIWAIAAAEDYQAASHSFQKTHPPAGFSWWHFPWSLVSTTFKFPVLRLTFAKSVKMSKIPELNFTWKSLTTREKFQTFATLVVRVKLHIWPFHFWSSGYNRF